MTGPWDRQGVRLPQAILAEVDYSPWSFDVYPTGPGLQELSYALRFLENVIAEPG